MPDPKIIDIHFRRSSLLSGLTSEGIEVPSIVRCDGIQVNAAAALSIQVVTLLT